MWKSTSELGYRVDGVRRLKFNFHTQVTFVRFEDDDDLDAAATLGPVMSGASIDWLDGGHLAPVFVEAGGLRLGEEALVDGVADAIARALDSSAVGLLE